MLGASSVLVALASVIRYKTIASMLGSSGMGTIGLMIASTTLAATLFGLGLGTSGVRAISASSDDPLAIRTRTRVLLWASAGLAIVAFACTTLLAGIQQFSGLDDPPWSFRLAMGATVASTVFNAGQLAFLNGRGRLGVMALTNCLGAVAGTGITVAGLQLFGYAGLAVAIVGVPLATAILTNVFVAREYAALPARSEADMRGPSSWVEFLHMVRLGVVVTAAMAVGATSQLIVRFVVKDDLGINAVGYYQGAFAVSSIYLAFLLGALAADYFPRLARLNGDKVRMNQCVNEQIVITLTIGVPVIAWAMVLAPLGLRLLYTSEFADASDLLRWQLAGDVLKLPGWALGFLLLATNRSRAFMATEIGNSAILVALVVSLTNLWGLEGVGVASVGGYSVYLVMCLMVARRVTGFVPSPECVRTFVLAVMTIGAILASIFVPGDELEWLPGVLAALLTAGALWGIARQVRKPSGVPSSDAQDLQRGVQS